MSDGRHLYFASELGNVFVVAADTKLNLKGIHPLPETCMATPAISDGTLFFRTRHQLIAIGEGGRSAGVKLSSQTAAAAEPPKLVLKKADPALLGEWQGTIQVGKTKLRGRFSLRDAGAEMKGTMTSLDQGNAKVEMSQVGDHDGTVYLKFDSINAHFQGSWNAVKDELKGEWHQLDTASPLTLKRLPPEEK